MEEEEEEKENSGIIRIIPGEVNICDDCVMHKKWRSRKKYVRVAVDASSSITSITSSCGFSKNPVSEVVASVLD